MLTKSVFVLVLALSVVGCASSKTTTVVENRTDAISTDASFLVAVEGDGKYIDKTYPGSGGMARAAMVAALSRYTSDVTDIPNAVPQDAAIMSALEQNVDYLVYLKINHWEDRATEWNGLLDRIEIEIRLLNGKSGDVLESTILTANSKWATLGGDHPQDLLPMPFNEYAASIFGIPISEGS